MDIDHYLVLGLPSGEEGGKLSQQEIKKAYLCKAIELHPDKRRNNPDAHADFIKLQSSYEVLKIEESRKVFDAVLRVNREKIEASQKLKEQARFRREEVIVRASKRQCREETKEKSCVESGIDKAKVVRVSWVKSSPDEYSAERLRVIFEKFGKVEDIAIKNCGQIGLALVLMASKDAVDAAAKNYFISSTLLVIPLNKVGSGLSGHQAFEESLLEKMNKERMARFRVKEGISRKVKREIARMRAKAASKISFKKYTVGPKAKSSVDGEVNGIDNTKVLRVSWVKVCGDYTSESLGAIFVKFGLVDDVTIKSSASEPIGVAHILMGSIDSVVVASKSFPFPNPLLVIPLKKIVVMEKLDKASQRCKEQGGTMFQSENATACGLFRRGTSC